MLNLCTSTTRDALRKKVDLPDPTLTYFTSRSFEGGRERHRLHLGFFGTLAEAQSWLPAVRDAYPAAWAGQLPVAASVDQPEPAARPVAVPTVQGLPSMRAEPLDRSSIPVARPAGRDPIPSLAPALRPPVLGAYAPAVGARTASGLQAVSQSGKLRAVPDRSPTGSTSSKLPAVRRAPAPVPAAPPPPPFYAVQLARAPLPMEIEDVPPIPLLDEYTLYTVEGLRDGARWYAVRVGFFRDLPSATAVAVKLRSEFAGLAIVGVSREEQASATGAEGSLAPVPVRASPTVPQATRWTPSAAEVNFGNAFPSGDPEDSLAHMVNASGEFAAGFLQQLGSRKRRLLRGRPFLRLLERLGGRIRDL